MLGVPVFVVILTVVNKLVTRKLTRSDLPTEVEDYRDLDHIDPITRQPVRRSASGAAKKAPSAAEKKAPAAEKNET